jgi:hypothetical protein
VSRQRPGDLCDFRATIKVTSPIFPFFFSDYRPCHRLPRHHGQQKTELSRQTIVVKMQKPKVCHLPPACCHTFDNAARTYIARSPAQILVPSLSLRIADDPHLAFVERGKYTLITPWLIFDCSDAPLENMELSVKPMVFMTSHMHIKVRAILKSASWPCKFAFSGV